jgi:WD40-like Beta Propeller Repeat
MRVAVGLVVGLVGCGRVDFGLGPEADAPSTVESFGAPQPMTILDSTLNDADPTLTDDQLEMYFSSDRPSSGLGHTDIYRTRRASVTAPWGAPEDVVELSSSEFDDSPEVSGDGLTLWLTTTRDVVLNRVYVATRPDRASAWGTPSFVAELSSLHIDTNLAISGDSLVAMIEHETGASTNDYDLYEHRRASVSDPWGPERHVVEISSPSNENGQCLDEYGLVVYFTSDRPGTQGPFDIYTATRPTLDDPFSTPVRVDAIDSTYDDGNAFLTRDGHTIYWSSNRPPNAGGRDLWFATR